MSKEFESRKEDNYHPKQSNYMKISLGQNMMPVHSPNNSQLITNQFSNSL